MIIKLQHFFLAVSLLVFAFSAVASTEEEKQQELEALKKKISAVQQTLQRDRAKRSEEELVIEDLEKQISRLSSDRRSTLNDIRDTESEIELLGEEIKAYEENLDAQKDQVAKLAYAVYVMGHESQFKLLLNQEDPAMMSRMLGYHHYINAARSQAIEDINRWVIEMTDLTAELSQRNEELTLLEHVQQRQSEALSSKREQRREALAALNRTITAKETELSSLEADEQRLQTVIRQIREHIEASAFKPPDKGSFARMKGTLPLPVVAPISARFGDPRDTDVSWEGVRLSADAGSRVRAIYKGRVVYADWLRGFGLLLIIDHGEGYMSLYSHNELLLKELGQWVDSGEVVSTVGASGGLERPALYFEIRHHGKPMNPLAWCKPAEKQATRG